jgi:hypothetical protein
VTVSAMKVVSSAVITILESHNASEQNDLPYLRFRRILHSFLCSRHPSMCVFERTRKVEIVITRSKANGTFHNSSPRTSDPNLALVRCCLNSVGPGKAAAAGRRSADT